MNIFKREKIKNYFLKRKYNGIKFNGNVRILGELPTFKMYSESKCIIGRNVVFNSNKKTSNTALTNTCHFTIGYTGSLSIGDNTMFNGVSITAYKKVIIGENCQIASNTFIADTDFHPISPIERLKQVKGEKYSFDSVNKKGIVIGDNVWICWGAIILKGTKIGNNSIVGAGSVVKGNFPENVVIAGNPARIVKYLDNENYE